MPELDVVCAWKDEEYRNSLPEDIRAQLPKAPDNISELSDEQLKQAAGGSFWSEVTEGMGSYDGIDPDLF